MAHITAADVSKLRQMTGAGMMDCKKALEEANGDFEKATEIIRERGQAVANKRADRAATQGAVIAETSKDGKKGAIISLNCETDFVAKNEGFVKFAFSILDLALEKSPASLDDLKNLPFGKSTVGQSIIEQIGIIGEKIELGYYDKIEAAQVIAYIHPGNKLSTLVGFSKQVSDIQTAKDVAMQVAAMNPVSLDKDDVPEDVKQKEFEIGREQARNDGKPENMLDKIAEGKLNKFYKESTLLNQEFIKDSKITIRQYLQNADKDLHVTKFSRFSLND
jgi:elongation factor Ts